MAKLSIPPPIRRHSRSRTSSCSPPVPSSRFHHISQSSSPGELFKKPSGPKRWQGSRAPAVGSTGNRRMHRRMRSGAKRKIKNMRTCHK
ncbi:hypothetical protein PVAP13_1NG198657 [Panicum virgatum]|uniref:Uncharacterized protein n=1 Tax=Panicum virgatum TaxID=38727 RepID=A0A8T0WQW5_PANVG|nr:hypothetical protein PVAP13_1NG198657 [Panicum virgatum]